jgi:hypothetical protein
MRNLARKQQRDPEVSQTLGTVVRAEGGALVVETETREVRAKRAASCLLDPVPGDVVLVAAADHDGPAYVLAVLEREAGTPGDIVADGDLAIRLPSGSLSLVAADGVQIVSSKEVGVVSGAIRLNAVDGSVALERLSFVGKLLRAEIGKAKVFGETLDSVLERVSQRVKRSYRIVEEHDHVRAEQIDYAAKKRLGLHGETALITAETLAKVEGDQIHLG